MNIKTITKNLRDLFKDDTAVKALVKNKVFISTDIITLIGKLDVPFINIEFDNLEVKEADNQNIKDYERHTFNYRIQFAVSDRNREDVLIGDNKLLDIYELLLTTLKKDPTLKGTVDKFIKTPTLITQVFPPTRENILFVAGGEIGISFSKDVFVR